jgi:hypothetical protein
VLLLTRTLAALDLGTAGPDDPTIKALQSFMNLLAVRLAFLGVSDLVLLSGARGMHIWAMSPTVSVRWGMTAGLP